VSSEERCEQQQAICAGECLFHSGEKQETNWSCWWQLGAPPPQRSPFHHPAAALHCSSSRTPQVERQQEQPVWPFQLPAPSFPNFCKKVLQTLPPQICCLKPIKPLSSPLLLNSFLPLPFFSATAIFFATATFSSATLMQQQRFLPQNTKSAKQKMNPFHDHLLENYFPQLQKNMKNLTTSKKITNSRTTLTLSLAIKNSLCNKTKNVCLCNETGRKKRKKASHLGPHVHGRRQPVGLLYREGYLEKGLYSGVWSYAT